MGKRRTVHNASGNPKLPETKNPETENFDVITSKSITPVSHHVYNIGQRFRRYYFFRSQFINYKSAIFDDGNRQTLFTSSYNELRDKPTIPTTGENIPSWVKETQNIRVCAVMLECKNGSVRYEIDKEKN